jgi:hypothetical protein
VQLWDGAQGATAGKAIPSEIGNVWSMAALTLPGPIAVVLFTGGTTGGFAAGTLRRVSPLVTRSVTTRVPCGPWRPARRSMAGPRW